MDKSLILCLYFPALGKARLALIRNDLKSVQRAVGGYIETASLGGHTLIVNEEGLLKQLPVNEHIAWIRGDAVLVDVDGDEFASLKTCPCCGRAISAESLIEQGVILEVIGDVSH